MKLTSQMSVEELRDTASNLLEGLRSDIEGVREYIKSSPLSPTHALTRMEKIEADLKQKSIADMNKGDLQSLVRELRYTRDLKSSTVSGLQGISDKIAPLKEKLATLSKDLQDKFWDVYQQVYSDTNGQIERFKYEIFQSNIIDYISVDVEPLKIANRITELHDKLMPKISPKLDYFSDPIYRSLTVSERREYEQRKEDQRVKLFGRRLKKIFE